MLQTVPTQQCLSTARQSRWKTNTCAPSPSDSTKRLTCLRSSALRPDTVTTSPLKIGQRYFCTTCGSIAWTYLEQIITCVKSFHIFQEQCIEGFYQNGVSLLNIMLEIHHSDQEPLICCTTVCMCFDANDEKWQQQKNPSANKVPVACRDCNL